jgi:membrane-associated protease RseP (regulator of RpoE activity)
MTVGSIMAGRPEAPQHRYTRGQSVFRLVLVVAALVAAGFASWSVLLFVLLFAVSIIAHEFGHYIVARKSGMKVTEFFIGFGPRIWSIRRGEVEYGLKAIPLGAYVKTPGMTSMETDIAPEDEPRTFRAQASWKRALMIFAGPAMNLLLALVGFCVAFSAFKEPTITSRFPAIEVAASPGDPVSPAAKAGLRTGDIIRSIDGIAIDPKGPYTQVGDIVRSRPEKSVPVVIERDGAMLTVPTVLGTRPGCSSLGYLGVRPDASLGSIQRNPLEGIGAGAKYFGSAAGQTVTGMAKVFGPSGLGRIFKTVAHSSCDDVTTRPISIIGISQIGGQAVRSGAQATILLISVVNLALGLLNLMPILPLDGGHLVMTAIERWKRRKRPDYVIDYSKALPYFSVAIVLLAFVMLSALYLDTLRLF